jgi:glycosyltransferase involved in cell wall biosynthesis
MTIRVLMQSRSTLFSVPGGDTVQVVKTREHLRSLGIRADISLDLEPDLSGYDLVHLFDVIRPQDLYLQARNARRRGVPIALSPIYVQYDEYDRRARSLMQRYVARRLRPSQAEYIKAVARALRNGERHRGTAVLMARGYRPLVIELLASASALLPNSRSELARISRDFGQPRSPVVVVPNGVDPTFLDAPEETSGTARGPVLCVGRIEGPKNQLALVRAVHGAPYEVLIVGAPAPNHTRYAQRVRAEAPANVRFLGRLPEGQLCALYRRAKVLVLPSWFETTGLAALEGGASGCNVVISNRGDAREYFGDLAYYCEPDSVDSIRRAVDRAWREDERAELRTRILRHFTWERTAERLVSVYGRLLDASLGGGSDQLPSDMSLAIEDSVG